MTYVQAEEKENLKTIITAKLIAKDPVNKKYAPMAGGDVQLDTICDAVTVWFEQLLPNLTVTVPGDGLLAPNGNVTGEAEGTIS